MTDETTTTDLPTVMSGDEIRPAIKTYGDLRNLMTRTAETHHRTPVYVRMLDSHGRDAGDAEILAVRLDADGGIRLEIQR